MTIQVIVHGSKKRIDKSGERVDFKESYFDKSARRVFKSVDEKADFLNSKGFVSSGDSDAKCKREAKQQYEKKMDERRK